MAIGFGVFAPQGWKRELRDIADPRAAWARTREVTLAAEAAGFDSIWVYDHFHCDPKPVQSPRPPVWIGGGGEQLTLRVVARLADWANFGGQPEAWAAKREVLKGHCKTVGRDEEEIGKSWSPDLLIRETEAEIR